ncbi:MAG: DoxX family protein [Bacteroidota bacterium]
MKNNSLTHVGLTILRVIPSAFMLTHGYPKFQKLINGDFEFPDPLGIGASPSLFLTVIGEFVCPILLILGFKTKWASVPAAITMFVAAFVVHGADPFVKKELALVYFTFFALIFLLGPGKYSIDRK